MAERRIEYQINSQKLNTALSVASPSLQRLYVDSALALYDHTVALDLVQESSKERITVSAPSRDLLLHTWLSALIDLFSRQQFLAKRIVFEQFDGQKIASVLHGEKYVPTRHGVARTTAEILRDQVEIGEAPGDASCFVAKFVLRPTK